MARIFFYTYNVGKFIPLENHIKSYKIQKDAAENKADIFVIALQEIPNSEISGVVVANKTWLSFFIKMMSDCKLTLIYQKYMSSNLLMVFSNINFAGFLLKVQTKSVGYNFGGTVGYKGTIGVCMTLRNNINLTFITSHFTHGDNNVSLRCKQYHLAKQCMFEDLPSSEKHLLFWFGDFNFRINDDSTVALERASNTKKELYPSVQDADQLYVVKRDGLAFDGFFEPEINFPPSYRFILTTDRYDHARKPSWCDRILVKSKNISYKNLVYDADISVNNSDHIPVFAIYEIPDLFTSDNLIPSLCIFQDIPSWTCSVYFMCHFWFTNDYFETVGSNMDWVGFYRHPVKNMNIPDYWMYMALCYQSTETITAANEEDNRTIKKYVAESAYLAPGQYVVAYYSVRCGTFIGISNVFKVST